jgi:hypothetical protein
MRVFLDRNTSICYFAWNGALDRTLLQADCSRSFLCRSAALRHFLRSQFPLGKPKFGPIGLIRHHSGRYRRNSRCSYVVPIDKKNAIEMLSRRITVVDPPPDIIWALQFDSDELVKPTSNTKTRISFDFMVDVVEDSSPNGFRLRGPAVQGRPGGRFVYLRIGLYAGQVGTAIARRAKIGLEGISRKLVESVKKKRSGVLEVQFAGTDRKGEPACATVPFLGKGWHVA